MVYLLIMPEFFEVKRIKNYLLQSDVIGKPITAAHIPAAGFRVFKDITYDQLQDFFLGNTIVTILTKAKYTLFVFEQGSMLVHYRFTGIPHISNTSYGDQLQTIYSLPIDKLDDRYIRFSLHLQLTSTI